MPQYRVILQMTPAEEQTDRDPRACHPKDKHMMIVEADTIFSVAADAAAEITTQRGTAPRVVSVEELSGWRASSITDEQITAALTGRSVDNEFFAEDFALDKEDYDEHPVALYGGGDFIYTAHDIVEALRESGLAPGLHISLLQNTAGFVDYSMIEVYEPVTGSYRAVGCDIKHLTENREARGWNAVLAIARALLNSAEPLM